MILNAISLRAEITAFFQVLKCKIFSMIFADRASQLTSRFSVASPKKTAHVLNNKRIQLGIRTKMVIYYIYKI